MATALKTTQSRARSRSQRARSQGQPTHLQAVSSQFSARQAGRSTAAPTMIQPTAPTVRRLPVRRPFPLWLRLLIQFQRGSVVVTFVLMTAALVVYGSTIYMQQHWSKGYNKLKSLERSERKMVSAEGLLKNQLIQQAEQPGSGLVPRTSANTIILDPAPERTPVATNPVVKVAPPPADAAPVGY